MTAFQDAAMSEVHRASVAGTLEYWARQIRAAHRVTGHLSIDQALAEAEPVRGRDGELWKDYYPASRTLTAELTIEFEPPSQEAAVSEIHLGPRVAPTDEAVRRTA